MLVGVTSLIPAIRNIIKRQNCLNICNTVYMQENKSDFIKSFAPIVPWQSK